MTCMVQFQLDVRPYTMGLTKCKSPGKALKSEGGVLGRECYSDLNVRMTPMRVKLAGACTHHTHGISPTSPGCPTQCLCLCIT